MAKRKKSSELDDFLDAPRPKRCVTCTLIKESPQFAEALARFEKRREEGTTKVGIGRFHAWLKAKGLSSNVSENALGRHYRECCTLPKLLN